MSTLEERIAVLEFRLSQAETKLAALASAPAAAASSNGSPSRGTVASDYDLDGPYGDPVIKKDPKRWAGQSFAGCKMSECSAEYLDELAALYDWMGDQDDAQNKTWTSKKEGAKPMPASTFKRKDAALARGWAKRIRARGSIEMSRYGTSGHGANAKHTEPSGSDDGVIDASFIDDEIPFVVPHDIAPRHMRRRNRWEKF